MYNQTIASTDENSLVQDGRWHREFQQWARKIGELRQSLNSESETMGVLGFNPSHPSRPSREISRRHATHAVCPRLSRRRRRPRRNRPDLVGSAREIRNNENGSKSAGFGKCCFRQRQRMGVCDYLRKFEGKRELVDGAPAKGFLLELTCFLTLLPFLHVFSGCWQTGHFYASSGAESAGRRRNWGHGGRCAIDREDKPQST